jgi:hypothetical protein
MGPPSLPGCMWPFRAGYREQSSMTLSDFVVVVVLPRSHAFASLLLVAPS